MLSERITTGNKYLVHGDVTFYPNSLPSYRGEEASARLRAALRYPLEHPIGDKRIIRRRFKILESINSFVTRGESQVTISDFDPPSVPEKVADRLQKSSFLPVDTDEYKQLVSEARTINDRRYWNQKDNPGHILIERVDALAFEKIQTEYGLNSMDEARRFFVERIEETNQALADILPPKISSGGQPITLRNETAFITSPGKVALYALSPNVDPRLQYEVLRTFMAAELLAKSEKHSEGLKAVIDEFQTAIDDNIFNHGQHIGETRQMTLYAIFDNETGKSLWNSHSDEPLSPARFVDFSQRGILKGIPYEVRECNEAGSVLTDPRTKSKKAILGKMFREALRRQELVGDEIIEPGGVSDLGGIKHILLDENSLDGDKITEFIQAHIDLAKEIFGPETRIVQRDETNGDLGQSQGHEFKRVDIFVTKDGREHKIEMLFIPLNTHLKNEYQYGPVDSTTGKRTGPAHKLYEALRWEKVAKVLFPSIYYGEMNWEELVVRDSNRATLEIQNQDAIPFNILPDEYKID